MAVKRITEAEKSDRIRLSKNLVEIVHKSAKLDLRHRKWAWNKAKAQLKILKLL